MSDDKRTPYDDYAAFHACFIDPAKKHDDITAYNFRAHRPGEQDTANHLADAMKYGMYFYPATRKVGTDKWRCGILFRWGSVWIGAHWSPQNKRLCVNILPFVTFWITPPYGIAP